MSSNSVWVVSYIRGKDPSWPYDKGDDPSFRKFHNNAGPLTWGVCSQDVRNKLFPGDLVVFFCADRDADRTEYLLAAFAQVRTKVRQTEIWEGDELERFRTYQNLLIAPTENTYFHYEPCALKSEWHPDWAWRIADHAGIRKSEIDSSSNELPAGFPCAKNYVIFDDSRTLVLRNPPVIAFATGRSVVETWRCDEKSKCLENQILGQSKGRGLRTMNPYQTHRHIKIVNQDSGSWFASLEKICAQFGLSHFAPWARQLEDNLVRSRQVH